MDTTTPSPSPTPAVSPQSAPQPTVSQTAQEKGPLHIMIRLGQNIGAFVVGLAFAYGMAFMTSSGLFTADMMNQYGEVVLSTEGSEMLVDISSGNVMDVKTTIAYSGVNAMVVTFAFDEEAMQFDLDQVKGIGETIVQKDPNIVTITVKTPANLDPDTSILTIPFLSEQTIWQTQVRTVFIVEADMGLEQTEDLIVFTNTPPNPNPEDDEYYGNVRY